MSDSEDDYMSDKLLKEMFVHKQDVRPGLVFNRTTKRQYELEKKRQEIEAKRPKSGKELENELREKGLNTAISSENKGFKLLAKMGFKEGQGLGKNKTGIAEPIKIELAPGRSGIGLEASINEKVRRMRSVKSETIVHKLNEFQNSNRAKFAQKFLCKDFSTAQKTCENLDFQHNIEDPVMDYFWTRATIKKRRKIEEEDEDEFYEEFTNYTTEENLIEIITYLRNNHLYCMFCAFVANDENDLNENCPGPYRSDHDDS